MTRQRRMKTVRAWVGIMHNGKHEPMDGSNKWVPFLYPTKKRARVALPSGWRIARVEIREVKS